MKGYRTKIRLRSLVLVLFFFLALPPAVLGQDVYNDQLNKGITNNEPYSYVLYMKAASDSANAEKILHEAVKHSPDFPAPYFGLSWANLRPGSIMGSIGYALEGIKVYGRNFWWSVSLYGLIYISLLLAFFISLMVTVAVRLPLDVELIRHDIKEERKNVLMLGVSLGLSFLGPVFFIAGALVVVGIYMKKADKLVVYITLLLLVFSPYVLRLANKYFSLASAELKAIVSVNEGHDNGYAIQLLKGKSGFYSKFSYALALKREGRYDEAIEVYKSILDEKGDPRVYVNLGNCYVRLGKSQEDKQTYLSHLDNAESLYLKANEIRPSVAAYYNLGQVYTEKLDYSKRDEYYQRAKELDRDAVQRFTAIASQSPNRLVADETLTMSEFWDFANRNVKEVVSPFTVDSNVLVFVSLAAFAFFYVFSKTKYRAYRCVKCNTTLCGRCSKDITWKNMCSECYRATVKLSSTDAKERVARLLTIHEHQSRRRNILRFLSFAPPGVAHIYAGRILSGVALIWLFMFSVVVLVLNPLFATGLYGFSHEWLNLPLIVFIVLFYALSNILVRGRVERGWL